MKIKKNLVIEIVNGLSLKDHSNVDLIYTKISNNVG